MTGYDPDNNLSMNEKGKLGHEYRNNVMNDFASKHEWKEVRRVPQYIYGK